MAEALRKIDPRGGRPTKDGRVHQYRVSLDELKKKGRQPKALPPESTERAS